MTDTQATVDDFLSARDRAPPAAAPASIGEIWNANWDAAGLSTLGAGKSFGDARSDIVAAIEAAASKPLGQYAREQGLPLGAAATPDENIGELASIAGTLPEDARKRIEPLLDWRRNAQDKAAKIERTAADVNASTFGLSANAVRLAAGLARQAVDPLNLAAMAITAPIGGEAALPLWQVFARQALAGGAAQLLAEPSIQGTRAELGLDHGLGDAAEDVFGAAAGNAAFAGGLTALLRGGAMALRAARRTRPGAPPEISAPSPLPAAEPISESARPNAGPSDLSGLKPQIDRMILADQRLSPWTELHGRLLSLRLSEDAGLTMPVMDGHAIRLLSEEAALTDRQAQLGARLAELPAGDTGAADTLARLEGINAQLAQAPEAAARKPLLARRDALLADTNPEQLAAAAAPIAQRRAIEAEQASIAARLSDIGKERAQLPAAPPPGRMMPAPRWLHELPLAPADLEAAARLTERDQTLEATAPDQSAAGQAAHVARVGDTHAALERGEPVAAPEPETIKSAAIRLKDGSIYTGVTHADALIAAEQARGKPIGDDLTSVDEKGIAGDFVTSTGRLVGRQEAASVAEAAAQVSRKANELGLIAENLKPTPALSDRPLPESSKAEALPEPTKQKTVGGPAARSEATYSLFEFLARRGGLRDDDALIADVRGSLGGKPGKENRFVPGFGNLVRKPAAISEAARRGGKFAPMSLDTAREAAVEAGYLEDAGQHTGGVSRSTVNDLLEAIDKEARGEKQYRRGVEPERKVDPAQRAHELNNALDQALGEVDVDPAGLSPELRDRTIEIMDKERVADPLEAYERAVMEETQHGAETGKNERLAEEIPGWDVPDDAGAAHEPGRAAAEGGPAGAREAARQPGEGDRQAPGGKLGDPALAADAARVLEEAGGDLKIVLDENGGEVSARDALKLADEDATAARELGDCAAMEPKE